MIWSIDIAMVNIKNLISALLPEQLEVYNGSVAVTDSSVIEQFVKREANTFLVSFPRTGSHWLRMIMELYFKRPSLVRIFYFPEITDYLTLHTHDKDLSVERKNVIYLYRDPVETVYSQLNYYNENINDQSRIIYWADQYGRHLDKWLYAESFTKKKTILTYGGMKHNMEDEFRKITDHFGEDLNRNMLLDSVAMITKQEVKKKTSHDQQVVQLSSDYEDLRDNFRLLNGTLVMNAVLKGRTHLLKYL